MSLYKNFGTNKEAESKGVSIEFGVNDDKSVIAFIVSRSGKSNKKYAKALEAATKPYRRQIQLGTMDDELANKIYMEVFISTVLKGWENVQDEKGKSMAFTKDNAVKLFTDLPELYEELQLKAADFTTFRDESREDDAKN